jgi:hypothetical protein
MKEAIGGTWLFTLVIAFLAVFTTFVSITTNYSRTYKIKDEIIKDIEYYNGINTASTKAVRDYIKGIGYTATSICPEDGDMWMGFNVNGIKENGYYVTPYSGNANYCIKKVITRKIEYFGSTAYYQVVVFFRIDWPMFRQIFNVKISGETAPLRSYTGDCITPDKSIPTIKEQLHCKNVG